MCKLVTEYYGCCRTTFYETRYEPCCPRGCKYVLAVDEYNMEECSVCEAVREEMEAKEREAEEAAEAEEEKETGAGRS